MLAGSPLRPYCPSLQSFRTTREVPLLGSLPWNRPDPTGPALLERTADAEQPPSEISAGDGTAGALGGTRSRGNSPVGCSRVTAASAWCITAAYSSIANRCRCCVPYPICFYCAGIWPSALDRCPPSPATAGCSRAHQFPLTRVFAHMFTH